MAVGARTSCNALTQCSVVGRDAPCGRSCGSGPTTFAMAPWSCMREIVLTCAPRKKQHRRHVRGSRAAMHTTCHAASSVPPLFALPPKVQIVGGSAAPPARGTTARGVRFEPPTLGTCGRLERGGRIGRVGSTGSSLLVFTCSRFILRCRWASPPALLQSRCCCVHVSRLKGRRLGEASTVSEAPKYRKQR